jgi:hypothetical protein
MQSVEVAAMLLVCSAGYRDQPTESIRTSSSITFGHSASKSTDNGGSGRIRNQTDKLGGFPSPDSITDVPTPNPTAETRYALS